MSKKSAFLSFMRYFSVTLVTVVLVVLLFWSYSEEFLAALFIVFILVYFPITFPVIGFWIYSFVKSLDRNTKTDRRFLWVHIADLIMVAFIVFQLNRPPAMCNADIMAEHYSTHGDAMNHIVRYTKSLLPDSARLKMEFGRKDPEIQTNIPVSDKLLNKEIERLLKDVDCIGLEIGNHYGGKNWNTVRFRRINFGMYSYRFYDKPLTLHEQDSINQDKCLIVYNDSVVFEYGGGVVGVQYFVGKDEFMEKLRDSKKIKQ